MFGQNKQQQEESIRAKAYKDYVDSKVQLIEKQMHEIRNSLPNQDKMAMTTNKPIPPFNYDKVLTELFNLKFPSKYEKGKEYNQVFIMEASLKLADGAKDDVKEDTYNRYYMAFDKKRNQLKSVLMESELTILIESNK